jgi:hypothetical protein
MKAKALSEMECKTITTDDKEIDSIFWDDEDGSSFKVGSNGVTKIEAYGEEGVLPYIKEAAYLAVHKNKQIVCRVTAYKVSIFYKEAAKAGE